MATRYSERTGQPQNYQVGPFDSTHIYIQWGGKLPGEEQWTCGLRMNSGSGSSPSDAETMLDGVQLAIAAYHGRSGSQISPKALLSYVKVNAIGVNGKYQAQLTTQHAYQDFPGGATYGYTGNYPNQVAWAVALTTGFSRGPAHRGRFFNPLPSAGVAADGRVTGGEAASLVVSAKLLVADLNAAGGAHQVVVMSRKAGAPAHRPVTGIAVGLVLDTQRRRRNSLAENYQS